MARKREIQKIIERDTTNPSSSKVFLHLPWDSVEWLKAKKKKKEEQKLLATQSKP